MSLFSGMKITDGRSDSDEGDASRTQGQTSSKENPKSAFSFVQNSKDEGTLSSSTSSAPDAEVASKSKFGFISSSPSPASQNAATGAEAASPSAHGEDAKSQLRDLGVGLELDLDLDIELDPLKPGPQDSSSGLAVVIGGIDLAGIDFSREGELSMSNGDGTEMSVNVRYANPSPKNSMQAKSNREDRAENATEYVAVENLNSSGFDFIKTNDGRGVNESSRAPSNMKAGTDSKELDGAGVPQSGPNDTSEDERGDLQQRAVHDGQSECALGYGSLSETDVQGEGASTGASIYDVELGISDWLGVLHEACAASEQQFRETQATLIQQLRHSGRMHLQSLHGLIRKQRALDRLYAEQAQAVNDEQYDKAEALTAECQALEGALCRLPNVSFHLETSVQGILSSLQNVDENRRKEEEEWTKSYKNLKLQQQAVIDKLTASRNSEPDSQTVSLETQKAELDRAEGHVLLDKNHIEGQEVQLHARIDEKTADLRETRDDLQKQREQVQVEIRTLEEQLARLRQEEGRLQEAVEWQEGAIEEVHAEFSEETSALEREKEDVREREESLGKERRRIEEEEAALLKETQSFQDSLAREEQLSSRISSSLEAVHSKTPDSDGPEISVLQHLTLDVEPSTDIIMLRDKVRDATEDINAASSLILSEESKLMSFKKRVVETEDHIATLQKAKQLAVSTKNFGEAKRLAGEIKESLEEGQGYQSEVETISETLRREKTLMEGLQEKALEVKGGLVEAERTWEFQLRERALTAMADITKQLVDSKTAKSVVEGISLEGTSLQGTFPDPSIDDGNLEKSPVTSVHEECPVTSPDISTLQESLPDTSRLGESPDTNILGESPDAISQESSMVTSLLETEKLSYALLVAWLSDRLGLDRPREVAEIVEDFEKGQADFSQTVQDAGEMKTTMDNAENVQRIALMAEIQELEVKLAEMVEAEDYDAAQLIQAQIESLQAAPISPST